MSIRTLLIGLDGATFTVLDPLMEQGVMPNLREFFAGGVRARLRTVVPPLTPPAWTSLMTGRSPGNHGVFDFFGMDPETRHIRFLTSNDVGCDTAWTLASAGGTRVTAFNFPSMFPAPRVNGYVIPGWVPWRQLRLACWPEGLLDSLKSVPGFNQRELAMDIKLEERTTEGCSNPDELGPWIELHTRREQNWFAIFRHLTQSDPTDLTAVVFDGVDKLQHLCWRFIRPEDGPPLTTEWEKNIRSLCLAYFRNLDDIIGSMSVLAGPQATVLLASDHGFGPTHQVFHVNTWLAERGYLAWSDAARQWDTQGAHYGVGQVAKHTWMLDWTRTKAFAATPTANALYIVVNRDGSSPGIAPEEYQSFRRRLVEDLLAYRDPDTAQPVVSRVWTREEAFSGPYQQSGPDLTLGLTDGGIFSILPSEQVIVPREVAGHHRALGIFGAKGPGVHANIDVGELSILDITPTMLYTLGLSIPEDLQGRVPEEVFEAAALRAKPIRKGRAITATADNITSAIMSTEDEIAVLERLRELGYVE